MEAEQTAGAALWHSAAAGMLFLFLLVVAVAAAATAIDVGPDQVMTVSIGETDVNITRYAPSLGENGGAPMSFLNLHQNENTSVVAARVVLMDPTGGSVTRLEHGGARYVSFELDGMAFTFDPNRMFTRAGVDATLRQHGNYTDAAAEDVLAFSQTVLHMYGWDDVDTVIALHNNGGGGYSAESYLPGGSMASEASKVNIVEGTDARNFFFVVTDELYTSLADLGFNVVLQNDEEPTDDGSLSVYAQAQGRNYVNVEALASHTSRGDQVLVQLHMLRGLRKVLGIQSLACSKEASCCERPTRTSLLVAALVAAVAATLAAVLIVLRIHDGKRRADASAQRLVAE